MSVKAMELVFAAEGITPTETLVLLALADHASAEGRCLPSHKTIGEKTKLSRRTVISTVAALEKRGLLSRAPRHRENGSASSNETFLDLIALAAISRPPSESLARGVVRETVGGSARAAPPEPRINLEEGTIARAQGDELFPDEPPAPAPTPPAPSTFAEAWPAYPKPGRLRSSKRLAEGVWKKAALRAGGEDRLLLAVQRYAVSPDATKEDGQFVPALERWLTNDKWEVWLSADAAPPARRLGRDDWQ